MKVVSNASPLIALGKLGQLGLLFKLYDAVLIPREVYNEVVVNGLRLGAPDAHSVDFLVQQGHIQIADVVFPSSPPAWAQPIDLGEVEVILLAQQQAADQVLIDNPFRGPTCEGPTCGSSRQPIRYSLITPTLEMLPARQG